MSKPIDPADLDYEQLARAQLERGGPAWRAAAEYGIDMLLLERNLELTPAQRLKQLNDALRLVGR